MWLGLSAFRKYVGIVILEFLTANVVKSRSSTTCKSVCASAAFSGDPIYSTLYLTEVLFKVKCESVQIGVKPCRCESALSFYGFIADIESLVLLLTSHAFSSDPIYSILYCRPFYSNVKCESVQIGVKTVSV